MKKRMLSLLLAAVMIVSIIPAAFAASGFSDVPDGKWYSEPIAYCTSKGLMSGVGNNQFAPNSTMTRAMVVTVLFRVAGSPADAIFGEPFTDVPADEWYTKPVLWATANYITAGTSDTTFSPNANITREQMVTFLYGYAKSAGIDTSASTDISGYSDYSRISSWAIPGFKWAIANGIVSGVGNNRIAPAATATRAECATILAAFDKMVNGETVPEETEPEATEPEATEPEVTEPEATEPETTEPSTDPNLPDFTTEEFRAELAAAVEAEINRLRNEEGVESAKHLPKMQQVAMYRSEQLVTDFSHNHDAIKEAHAKFEYGEWIDVTEGGMPPEYSYWASGANEAIVRNGANPASNTITDMSRGIASAIHRSSGHWAYVGNAEMTCIAVGVRYNPETNHMFTCVMVNTPDCEIYG